jgi:hypothetical protein
VWREPARSFDFGLDLEGAAPVNAPQLNGNAWTGGAGVKVRAGEQLDFRGGLRVVPEVGYGYDSLFVRDAFGDEFDWSMHRFFGGARIGAGRYVVPAIFTHLGYGWQVTGEPGARGDGGLAWDFGAALDFRLVPAFAFGFYVEYAAVEVSPDEVSWTALGLRADLFF